MPYLIAVVRTETGEFMHRLHRNTRLLFHSDLFYILAEPIFSLFISAYLWNVTGSLVLVGMYYSIKLAAQTFLFVVNGWLLRFIPIRTLFLIGALSFGASVVSVVLFDFTQWWAIVVFAVLNGFCGLYWGNRNYLELQETCVSERSYFYGTLFAVQWIAHIAVPFVAGWFVVLGPAFGLFAKETTYWILFGIALVLMLGTAFVIRRGTFESVPPRVITRLGAGTRPVFNARRLLTLARGSFDGVYFVSIALTLFLFGSEGVLGSLAALASLVTAIALYIHGRVFDGHHKTGVLVVSSMISLGCTAILAHFASEGAALLALLVMPSTVAFFAVAARPLELTLSEEEMAGDESKRYSFIVDNELFLNTGRIMGIACILGLACIVSLPAALFVGPLCAAVLRAGFLAAFLRRATAQNMVG